MFLTTIFSLVTDVSEAHGAMTWPPTWLDANGAIGLDAGAHCSASAEVEGHGPVGSCMWFNNYTFTSETPTLPMDLRTYRDDDTAQGGVTWEKMPWAAPGTATHIDGTFYPCGVGGGNPRGCPMGDPMTDSCPGGGFGNGPDARHFDFDNVVTTEWKAGDVVEAAWGIVANHGGGYSYRLCPADSDLEEDCFQAGALDFSGSKSWVQIGKDSRNRIEFDRSSFKTPNGNEWAMNPIAPCGSPDGGAGISDPTGYARCSDLGLCQCPESVGTQFPVRAYGLEGFGEHSPFTSGVDFKWSIVDRLQVPKDMKPGKYVLSWRWDCEQTPQVWALCSDIRVVPADPSPLSHGLQGLELLPPSFRQVKKQSA